MFSRALASLAASLVVAVVSISGSAWAVPFTPGNVVVYRVGDGSAALTSAATAAFLDEYTATGTLVQSIALPTITNGLNFRLVSSGSAASDGFINRSVDGRVLMAAGYDGLLGSASITGTASTTNPRVVALIRANGSIDTTTALTDAASATNFRSAASTDGSSFWVTGGAGTAVRFATFGATTSTQLFTTPSNFRSVGIVGGQLYVASGTGSFRMASVGTGTPTTAGQTITSLPGLPTTVSLYDQFFFADLDAGVAGVDTLYLADETTAVGIIKYSLVGGTWVSNGSITGSNFTGLTGVVSGANVTLYASRNGTQLSTFTDTSGYNGALSGTVTVIRTAATNTAFRGVAMAPDHPINVTSTAGANGTISPLATQQFQLGRTATFTVTPDAGFSAVVGGTCGGSLVGNTYTTSALSVDCSVDASFSMTPTFSVTPSAGVNGSISPTGVQTVLQGGTQVFTVTPNSGYSASVGGTCGGNLVGTTYTTNAITMNCTVDATFTLITFAVTPSAGTNGTIAPNMVQNIASGTTTVFTVTPDAGYSATVGGSCGGTLVGTTYTTNAIVADCNVSATFALLPVYTVTPVATANGNISPTMAQSVISGNTTAFTVTPNPGYNVAVRGTCGGSLSGNVYTTRPITANCTVTATFATKVVLFVGNSYTFGRIDPVMSYNTANVTDLTLQMWILNSTGSNVDEPHPWGGIPGVFKKFADQAMLDYDVSISARNAASLRGHYLNSNPAGWDLRGNVASQKWNAVVLQDLSDQPLPAGRSPNANLPYFNAYADKFEAWAHVGAAESYTETTLFGGGNSATCAAITGASTVACDTVRNITPANANASAATDIYLYQTWARPDLIAPNGTNAGGTTYTAVEGLELMTSHFHDSYFGRAAANPNYKAVNPVGNAFLRAVTSGIAMRDPYMPEAGKINLWHTDFFHPSKYGSYLSALVHFAMISGINPMSLGAGELAAIDLGISSADAVSLQQVARDTVVPAAPTIGTATGGNGQVTVNFTPPNNVGGLTITGYTATCGGQSNTGPASPIVVSGLTNGTPVTCTVTTTNSVGASAASIASNSVTPSITVIITSTALGGGTVGVAYTQTVLASGSPAPTFSVTTGALPTGLTLNPTSGLINGTPTTANTFMGTIQATNGVSSDTQNFSVAIAQGSQTINFGTLSGKILGDPAFPVSAMATSNLTVSFTSTTPSICTATGTNGATITLLAAGNCTIAANQAGDANYAMAMQVTQSFMIAAPSVTDVVISQVYGGGGNASATYRNDFIELFNRGSTTVNISGWSVQYASATGTTWTNKTDLTGSIPPGGYYLVQEASNAAVGLVMPTPDASGSIAMAGGAGKVALVNGTTFLSGACPTSASIVDFVGYGATANCFEGVGATPAPSNSNSVIRAGSGCTDINSNVADFSSVVAAPRNSSAPTNVCNPLPALTINNVSQVEGTGGTTTFTFTVTLAIPALAGGVSFDIATQDGTATAGNDYTAKTLLSQVIPQGMTTYTFTVDVNPDAVDELSETFLVNITNVTGANIIDGQGLGTIVNDDASVNLTINSVSQTEGNAGTSNFTFTVSLSGPAPVGGVTFDIATANGTATAGSDYVSQSLTGQTIPQGSTTYMFSVVVNGDTTGESDETFFVNVSNIAAANPVTTQGVGTILTDDIIRIHTLQGNGNTSPFTNQVVTVEGIVTADYQAAGKLTGFFIQEPDNLADADATTSEGVFVFTNLSPTPVSVGQRVRVTGTVTEFGTAPNSLTEIGTPALTPTVAVLSSGNPLPAYVTVSLPVATAGELERYEGMRIRLTQSLTVSDHFDLAHFGTLTLTANGRALQPTNIIDPNDDPASGTTSSGNSNGAAVTAFSDLLRRSSINLDDGSSSSYPPVIPYLDPMTNTIRLGSTVSTIEGVLGQAGGVHALHPDVAPVFTYAARPVTPPVVGGNVKVASMNVLNYFNGNGSGVDGAPGGYPTSRGANSLNEFARQRAKVLAAVLGLNADVVGLLEMENDGNGATSSIQDLINGLNTATAPGTWAFIADPAGYTGTPGGSDQIRPAIIYKPATVAPDGVSLTSSDSAFSNGRSPVAQTFRLLSNNEKFTLVVNHFKSKSSGGASGLDTDQGDGQAAFNNRRKLQANALLGFMATLTAATPRIITMGDFNAYEQEDPIDILRAGGYATIVNGDNSYMFDGLSGSLDHALGSTALTAVVTGAGHWHINADEPIALDYNVETKVTAGCNTPATCTSQDFYDGSPFRASDHDPVLVGLQLNAVQCLAGTFSATGNAPCTPASPGNFVTMAGAMAQTQCIAGTYQPNSGATSCIQADPGRFVAMSGATTQTLCLAGTFQMNSGAASCDQAQPGNFVAVGGATSQTACLAGSFQMNNGATSCSQAQPGNFVAVIGATSQTACLAGTFQASSGATSCGQAQPGNFVAMAGAIAQTACLSGTFQANSGAVQCDAAQPGNFVAGAGASSQTACSPGTFQANSNATSCNPASPGSFVAGSSATAQTPCTAGSFQASAGQSSCGLAQPGFFVANAGAISQTVCPAGTTSTTAGATSCSTVFFNVSPSAGINGSISPRIVQSIAQGTTTTFMVSADAGYSASVGGTCGGSFNSGTFTTNAIIADCTVDATFTLDLAFVAVQSRKFHGATPYDIAIDTGVGAPATVEPRTIGSGHTIVFQFNVPITAAGTASVVDANAAPIGVASTSASGNDVIVTITAVPDNRRVVISLAGVNGSGSASAQIGFLTGDANNTRSVTASDISGVKARSGQTTTAANFRFDVNASGSINSADISAVKARSGLSLP